jgi:hypothetical protein
LSREKDNSSKPKPRMSLNDYDVKYDWENEHGQCHDYLEEKNKCVTGHNMEKLTGVTLEECQYACSNTYGCEGIEFFKRSYAKNAADNYKPGDCNLSSSTNTVGCDAHKW